MRFFSASLYDGWKKFTKRRDAEYMRESASPAAMPSSRPYPTSRRTMDPFSIPASGRPRDALEFDEQRRLVGEFLLFDPCLIVFTIGSRAGELDGSVGAVRE